MYSGMSKTFLLGFVLIVLGGAALWVVAFRPQWPQFSLAQNSEVMLSSDVQSEVTRIDQQLAQKIRDFGEHGIDWQALTSPPQVAGSLAKASQATISAQVSTTPEELWRTLREEGSQAVLGTLAKNAEISVNTVSTEVMNEARYQYCVGVVQQYEALQEREQ